MAKYLYISIILVFFVGFAEAKAPKRSDAKSKISKTANKKISKKIKKRRVASKKTRRQFLLSYKQLMKLSKVKRYRYIRTVAKALARIPEGKRKKSSWFPFPLIDEAVANSSYRCMGGGVPVPGDSPRCGLNSYAGFTCPSGKEICNPLIFGVRPGNPPQPICYNNATTARCYRNTRVGTSTSLDLVFDQIGSTEWNRLKSEMDQFCSLASSNSDQIQEASFLANDACNIVREQSRINVRRELIADGYQRPSGATRADDPQDVDPNTGAMIAGPEVPEAPNAELETTALPSAGESDAVGADGDADPEDGPERIPQPAPLDAVERTAEPMLLPEGRILESARGITGLSGTGAGGMMNCIIPEGTHGIVRGTRSVRNSERLILELRPEDFNEFCSGLRGLNGQPQILVPLENAEAFYRNPTTPVDPGLLIAAGRELPLETIVELSDASTAGMYRDPDGERTDFINCRIPGGTQGMVISSNAIESAQVNLLRFPNGVIQEHCPDAPETLTELAYVSRNGANGTSSYPLTSPTRDIDPAVTAMANGEQGPLRVEITPGEDDSAVGPEETVDGTPPESDTSAIGDVRPRPRPPGLGVRPRARPPGLVAAGEPAPDETEPDAELLEDVEEVLNPNAEPDETEASNSTNGLPVGSLVEFSAPRGQEVTIGYLQHDIDGDGDTEHLVRCDFTLRGSGTRPAQGIIVARESHPGHPADNMPVIQFTESTFQRFCKINGEGPPYDPELLAVLRSKTQGAPGGPYRIKWPDNDTWNRENANSPHRLTPFSASRSPMDEELQSLAAELNLLDGIPEELRYKPIRGVDPPSPIEQTTLPPVAETEAEGDGPDSAVGASAAPALDTTVAARNPNTSPEIESSSPMAVARSLRPEARPADLMEGRGRFPHNIPNGGPYALYQYSTAGEGKCIPPLDTNAETVLSRNGIRYAGSPNNDELGALATGLRQIERLNGGRLPTEWRTNFRFVNGGGTWNFGQSRAGWITVRRGSGHNGAKNISRYMHELGHKVGWSSSGQGPNNYEKFSRARGTTACRMTTYCGASRNERFAETFAAFIMYPELLEQRCPQVFDFFKTEIFPNSNNQNIAFCNGPRDLEDNVRTPATGGDRDTQ